MLFELEMAVVGVATIEVLGGLSFSSSFRKEFSSQKKIRKKRGARTDQQCEEWH